jgi:TonB-dependent starch-binding outer membrane protein SusC
METKVSERQLVGGLVPPWRRAARYALAMALALAAGTTAHAQQITVTGTVNSSTTGLPISGVTVNVKGTEVRVSTTERGRYTILAPSNGQLSFFAVSRKPVTVDIGGRTTINVSMESISYLEQTVVTAYTETRRAEITGAVSTVDVDALKKETGASVLKRLDAVPGITVQTSGSPGSRSTVRIRGISSFQNNDPLYVIDGVPVQDSYINFLNPNDIASIQVLKDASASSIYGSRASNGVILIETTKGGANGPPKMTATIRTGMASPVNGYDNFTLTNSLDYFAVVKKAYENAGLPAPTNIYGDPNAPTVPAYTFAANDTRTGLDAFGRPVGVDESKYSFPNSLIMPGSPGTNWWKAVFGTGQVTDANFSVTGAGTGNQYGISFNYFNQDGTAAYNNFRRVSVRANTQFTRGKLSFGENVGFSAERQFGGLPNDDAGETALIGKNILMQPVVPIYDINGNFASGKAVGLGNNTNPLKAAFEGRNNINKNNRVFGNLFAGLALMPSLTLRSSLGFNVVQGSFTGYNAITPENSEPSFSNSINENSTQSTDWTWSNTAKYATTFGSSNLSVLVGQEANAGNNRFIAASQNNLLNTDPSSRFIQDALGDAKTKVVNSFGGESALLSFFGKADYNFDEKYIVSLTVRRDGSSRLGPNSRWGTFPAVGLGWRLSKEGFLKGSSVISDAMLRVGYGVTGNQAIPSGRIVSQFGGSNGDTFYDITGSNSTVQAGFRQTSLGNANLKWEENRSTNIGADLSLFNSAVNVIIDVYDRATNNLLFDPALPGVAGIAAPPIVNIGRMSNRGFDISLSHTGNSWNVSGAISHYRNRIKSIDGQQQFFFGPIGTRIGNAVINQVGQPIGSFFGLQANGYFRDAADVTASPRQDGAAPGRIKFVDTNGDGQITAADRTIIGSPHPSFTSSFELGYRRGNFDVSASLFGSFGNKIFDAQKDFYVFRTFSTNVRKDLLENSWTPTNQNAKYPIIDQNDTFSRAISSYYVEDGSYVRLRNLQVGWNVPASMSRWVAASRVYLQAENLFTITGYSGLDPSLPTGSAFGAAGDVRDQFRGVDTGVYPSSRTFSLGITASF